MSQHLCVTNQQQILTMGVKERIVYIHLLLHILELVKLAVLGLAEAERLAISKKALLSCYQLLLNPTSPERLKRTERTGVYQYNTPDLHTFFRNSLILRGNERPWYVCAWWCFYLHISSRCKLKYTGTGRSVAEQYTAVGFCRRSRRNVTVTNARLDTLHSQHMPHDRTII